jgi:hypothetical protein
MITQAQHNMLSTYSATRLPQTTSLQRPSHGRLVQATSMQRPSHGERRGLSVFVFDACTGLHLCSPSATQHQCHAHAPARLSIMRTFRLARAFYPLSIGASTTLDYCRLTYSRGTDCHVVHVIVSLGHCGRID